MFFHGISEAAYAVLSMAESHDDKAVQSGHWVGKIVQTYEGVYSTLCFETHWNLANGSIIVSNKATVDVPGVIISLLRRPCKHELYLFGRNRIVYIGLPKVAQTESGTAKLAWAFCWGVAYFMQWSDYSYRRGLWRCLFNQNRQLLEPQTVGWTTRRSHAFLCP